MSSNRFNVSRLGIFFFFCAISFGARAADLSQATVRQKFNVVTLAPNIQAAAHPVNAGAMVQNENVVRTGTESRAELQFSDLTLARLGANSLFTFDAQTRSMECNRGAVLFSKPKDSGRVEIRSGAVTAAITGSTGFVSVQSKRATKKNTIARAEDATVILGMLEGKLRGNAVWRDGNNKEHTFPFSLGAGEMLVAQPGRPPAMAQFNLPRFLRTSPLIIGFSGSLLNDRDLQHAVASYQSDERRGFIQPTTVPVTQSPTLAWVSATALNHNALDVSVDALGSRQSAGVPGIVPVGGNGVIRGQLVWMSDADLDLHLVLPDQQEVFFANPSVTFNSGRATAVLDHDNLGGVIDAPPDLRVENIAVNGTILAGTYTFFGHSFSTDNGSDSFTLTVVYAGHTQRITGTLTEDQNSKTVTVQVPTGQGHR